jgi:hypothetical protein
MIGRVLSSMFFDIVVPIPQGQNSHLRAPRMMKIRNKPNSRPNGKKKP